MVQRLFNNREWSDGRYENSPGIHGSNRLCYGTREHLADDVQKVLAKKSASQLVLAHFLGVLFEELVLLDACAQ